jgi:hypothetical protein
MDGATIRNLHQASTLGIVQGPLKPYIPADQVYSTRRFGFAIAILGMDLLVADRNPYSVKRPLFPIGIHAKGDGRATSQGGSKELVGSRSRV